MSSTFRADNYGYGRIQKKIQANGFLRISGSPTRAGVFPYKQADGSIIRELRSPEEVFKAESMNSLKLVPVINQDDHIKCLTGKVPPNEAMKFHKVGTVGDNVVQGENNRLDCDIMIYDQSTIDDVDKNQNMELSPGYTVDIVKESGIFQGDKYDQKQVNIVYGHLALVDRGRAGSNCRLRIDSGNGVLFNDETDFNNSKKTGEKMPDKTVVKRKVPAVKIGELRLDSIEIEESDGSGLLIDRCEQLIREVEKNRVRADKAEGELTVIQKDNKDLKKKSEGARTEDQYRADLKESVDLLEKAKQVGLTEIEDYTPKGLKLMICGKLDKDFNKVRADKDDGFLDGVYSGIQRDWEYRLSRHRTDGGLDFEKQRTAAESKGEYTKKSEGIGSMKYSAPAGGR